MSDDSVQLVPWSPFYGLVQCQQLPFAWEFGVTERLIENGAKTWCDLITTQHKAGGNSFGATCFRGVKVFQVITHFINRYLAVRELQIRNAHA